MVYLLARRDHSERELRLKLKNAEHSEFEINLAIEEARARKWLPDEQMLATREADRLARLGKSPQQIRAWLARKGLPIDQLQLQELLQENEMQSAHKTAIKVWDQQKRLAERQVGRPGLASRKLGLERVFRDRMQRLLISRGFSVATARAVFARLLKENPLN
jgi:SOS response regulatory protein OraA/RecX